MDGSDAVIDGRRPAADGLPYSGGCPDSDGSPDSDGLPDRGGSTPPRVRPLSVRAAVLVAGAVALPLAALWALGGLSGRAFTTWQTVCVAVAVQALPFLVLGTLVSSAISAFVPPSVFTRALPRRPALAVPVASAAGVVLPGCECASVPVAKSLIGRGVPPAAAFAFLLSAPAVNPVVLVSTAVAFPGDPAMVAARLVASLAVSMAMGWLWLRLGRTEWLRPPDRRPEPPAGGGRWARFAAGFQHDFLHAGGFLVVGAMAAATFNVLVPRSVLGFFSASPWASVLFLALLAVVLAVCSEADAFIAASLTGFSPTAKLAFMVVGPMVDLKLVALQAGAFGRAFALRFSLATGVVAVAASALAGWWLL